MESPQIDVLQSLQRGEIAATETYQQAIEKLEEAECAAELATIHKDHRIAANMLRQHLRGHGGESEKGSGAWGAFAKVVEGTAKVFGETAALKALQEGEEHGVKEYEAAVTDETLPADCASVISRMMRDKVESSARFVVPAKTSSPERFGTGTDSPVMGA